MLRKIIFFAMLSASIKAFAVNPFSDCGIGAAIFPNNGPMAAITNATFDLGSTAITSATASPETCSSNKKEIATYLLESVPHIESEIFGNSGQYISALSNFMGCPSNTNLQNILYKEYDPFLKSKHYALSSQEEKALILYSSLESANSIGCKTLL